MCSRNRASSSLNFPGAAWYTRSSNTPPAELLLSCRAAAHRDAGIIAIAGSAWSKVRRFTARIVAAGNRSVVPRLPRRNDRCRLPSSHEDLVHCAVCRLVGKVLPVAETTFRMDDAFSQAHKSTVQKIMTRITSLRQQEISTEMESKIRLFSWSTRTPRSLLYLFASRRRQAVFGIDWKLWISRSLM